LDLLVGLLGQLLLFQELAVNLKQLVVVKVYGVVEVEGAGEDKAKL